MANGAARAGARIGVDIGGTFTDVVLYDGGPGWVQTECVVRHIFRVLCPIGLCGQQRAWPVIAGIGVVV